ncbi:MAG: membrane protein insertion efficiency factor YidD [Treponema sp.]|nr:membrane protein insertion efficiency factor YidD [Treponema sp.]
MSKGRIICQLREILYEFLCLPIRFYKVFISPFLPPCCRFEPTCSAYAIQAIKKHGFFKGFFLSLKRILKCNPYFEGGYDPVPEKWHLKNIKYKTGNITWKKIQ